MNTNQKTWNPLKNFGTLFISIFFFLQVVNSLLTNIFGRDDGFYYYPSFFVQNYILRLYDVPKWTHESTGGGDTIDDWVLMLAYVIMAVLIAAIWRLIDYKRKNYITLYLWTKIAVRYYLGVIMLLYGWIKIFLLQMPYPKLSYFYTPFGDFSPMDLVWTFIGYSAVYEFLGGFLEVLSGLLIFFRRTLVLGLIIMLGVMGNVVLFNYLYGVPVKLFSTTLVIMGLFLLLEYIPTLINFILGEKESRIKVEPLQVATPWKKKTRLFLKFGSILIVLVAIIISTFQRYSETNTHNPIEIEGAFDVHSFEINGKENQNYFDSIRWNQVVVNKSQDGLSSDGHVMFGTTKREMAIFEIDSTDQLKITFVDDSTMVFTGRHVNAKDSLIWSGEIGSDSAQLVLKRNKRAIPLHETPFKFIHKPGRAENITTRR